ncbi:unnamed protein product [Pleuronectes platessa]|uniref:Uncharacterized protein n=1 Tax=Pleuronectes platessa TaxID=8262 RepID=A0A9N7W152_PLEPL|nr:unnamed protein product [Pleuronectes platessa]
MADHIDATSVWLGQPRRRLHLPPSLPSAEGGREGKVTFMDLNLTTKSGKIKLDRAHRSLAPRPGTNQRSRPIIMKLHNFADKQRVVVQTRRQVKPARRLGADQPADRIRVSFFNDYSAAVARKRKAFDEVKGP